ncbi:hypothetical protein CHS0354_039667 [Potamilus streckersoni]|uniref:Kinesin-like protein 6 n=1 Tax=Potamilus streckersoni TaxID=2493646 RepID=A0AAE0SJI0_9BIVA|nr:hypothetical protein CHS0354_039667 [Potamilus streckersoni]
MPAGSDSVKVAVRVRPFNQREKNAGSKCIISMNGQTTVITNPENGDTKSFSYDHSYWSHDDFNEDEDGVYHPASPEGPYADQKTVFNDLGKGVLDNAWQGYNAALFAYGQTGSGKSYSMIGYGANKGIVPITCEELFKVIDDNEDKEKQLQVTFSMLEIYNEQVRDLLVKTKPPHGGLKIRQNPSAGFYVEGLRAVPVRAYTEIEKLMEQGTINRTTASTNMNATSSRSHMVITIRFVQVFKNAMGQSNTRSSDVNLVDLAGSERADSTGATGDRLKEGSAINQSLSTLGNVISALADLSLGKKKVLVPYRDSVLTKLLQSALGGNSRTIMIAALSPADINYDETLSTLRYADRAKKIQNKAVVNESPTERLIRELKEENAKLMQLLQKQQGIKGGGDTSELQKMLEENQRRMADMQLTWEQRLEQARLEWERSQMPTAGAGVLQDWQKLPYITNVNEDSQLSGVIKHCFKEGETTIGRSGVSVEIRGLGILEHHVTVTNNGKALYVTPTSEKAMLIINGLRVKDKRQLCHMDRIKLGSSSLFLYVGLPSERKDRDDWSKYDFDYFMMELAEHEGVDLQTAKMADGQDQFNNKLNQEFVDLLPKIMEANAISEELKKKVKFEPMFKHDSKGIPSDIIVKVLNTETKKVWVWPKLKFLHRKDLIDSMYLSSLDGQKVSSKRAEDPFWDPVEDICLGSCLVILKSLAHHTEIDEHFALHNHHGHEEAVVKVQIMPCDQNGKSLHEDDVILEPTEMLGKPLNFVIKVQNVMSIRWVKEEPSRGIYFRYKFYDEKEAITKAVFHKTVVDLDYTMHYSIPKVTKNLISYLLNNSLVLELWGKQVSEDEQLHRRVGQQLAREESSEDLLSQLKNRETVIENLESECTDLRDENFKLKMKVDKLQQALEFAKMRRETGPKNDRRKSISEEKKLESSAMDVELAKAFREFFKDIKPVQQEIKDMKSKISALGQSGDQNGNLKSTLKSQEKSLNMVDENLTDCVNSLKKSVAVSLKKQKEKK